MTKFGSTERTQFLKDNLVSKACYKGEYEHDIKVDITRAKLYTESYRETEGEIPVLRRAKALRHVLSKLSINIFPRELIVGYCHADPHVLSIFPEQNTGLLREALDDGFVPPEHREDAEDLLDYWKNKTIAQKVMQNMDEETLNIVNTASSFISTTWKDGIQHCVPNWDFLFANGTIKLKEMIGEKLGNVKKQILQENSPSLKDLIEKRYEYEGMLIALEGLEIYLDRYADLAEERAAAASDAQEKEDLQTVGRIMRKALRRTPTSFHEACQGFYTIHLILNCIDSAAFGSLARIDQLLYPYFRNDIQKNELTEAEAQEIIECMILKIQSLGSFFSKKRRLHFEGNGALPIWSIGGIHEDGSDACNELTDVVLRAARSVRCNQPTISIMYHDAMREASLEEAINTVKGGLGYPSFTNTSWMVKSLMGQGIPENYARNAGVVGCVSVCPVDSCNTTKRLALTIIASKCLELALNEGVCPVTGKLIGPKEKPADQFTSYEEVEEAFRRQLDFAMSKAVNIRNIARYFEKLERPNPLASAMHKTPIEKGIDAVGYEDFRNNHWMNMVGLINVVNSLAVIKKLIFEENRYTMEEMVTALKANWDGHEAMRQTCLNKVPKYGNDDAYVDDMAVRIFDMASDIAGNIHDINGGYWSILAQSVSIYQSTAAMTGAMPDGKMKGKPVSDGGVSPDHGTDREGVFPVLTSDGKLHHTATKGLLLNQWISPELLEGEQGLDWMKSLLKMWYEKDISQIQFNVVDPVVLRKAQENPKDYTHLTVRVSGYTADWVKLTPELQEVILSRTCQTTV